MDLATSRVAVGLGGRVWVGLFSTLLALSGVGLLIHAATTAAADDAPQVRSVAPSPDARGVAPEATTDGSLTVTFSEPVTMTAPLALVCERSGTHAPATSGGPMTFSFFSDRPLLPGEGCLATIHAESVSDADGDDPPDHLGIDFSWGFWAAAAPVVINEIDAVTPGGLADLIELYDGGRGDTPLDGVTVVFYRGDETSVYLAVGLDGYWTDEAGYFVLGASGVAGADLALANDALRDGPDGVAVYDAPATDFPRNAPLTTAGLLDAVVYGSGAGETLLELLAAGQTALDEDSRGTAATDSSQRCPDGGGRPRETTAFVQNSPTPGEANRCRFDEPPQVVAVSPAAGETDVALDTAIEVLFSEPVETDDAPLRVDCERSGVHAYHLEGGGETLTATLTEPLVREETCVVTVFAERVGDADNDDPPDRMRLDFVWSFRAAAPLAEGVLINEIDADTPGIDAAEFIELFDGGVGGTPLDGLALVLFNGADDDSYLTLSLDGYATDGAGYFVLGNGEVNEADAPLPDGVLQNGPDGVALVAGDETTHPNGTPVTATMPIDAVVYARSGQEDAGLQPLLNPAQPQVDENGRGDADAHSNQRCPNGAGGARNTIGYRQNTPTPGAANDCVTDAPPEVTRVSPDRGATGVPVGVQLTVVFNEPVTVGSRWLTLKCADSGVHAYRTTGGPTIFTVEPTAPPAYGERCTVTIAPGLVSDQDTDDPPDTMTRKKSWSFTTAAPPADFVLINEIDPDTPGTDTVEFIELYDGGVGQTALDGLTLVLFNGSTNRSYRAIDLDGYQTNGTGYFVVGNAAVGSGLVIGDGTLQNGPDAVALYAADATQFPFDSPVSQTGLIDAVVYGDGTGVSPELLALLAAGETAADENGRGAADLHSLQRCPNGAGGARRTSSYLPNAPTPGAASNCIADDPPVLVGRTPDDGARNVSVYAGLSLVFSEPVTLASGAVSLSCDAGGERLLGANGGPQSFEFIPAEPLPAGDSCRVRLSAALVGDVDTLDPPDHPTADAMWSFTTAPPPVDFVLINEVDADTPGSDTAEFIELYDGGIGHTSLDGLALVFFNGATNLSYRALDLDGLRTDANGYLVAGNAALNPVLIFPNGVLQNGPDAVALYAGDATHFPTGSPVREAGLIDAVVYGDPAGVSAELLALLMPGEAPADEDARGAAGDHSLQRCPNGTGGARRTAAFVANRPTPGGVSDCVTDDAPGVTAAEPPDGATDMSIYAGLTVRFSEPVTLAAGVATLSCVAGGDHTLIISGGPEQFQLAPSTPLRYGDTCRARLFAASVSDIDVDDPPDHPTADYEWSFTTVSSPPDFVIINEADADTPGSDAVEFIELYDGGRGRTDLSGLVIVLYNGSDDRSYHAIDLAGAQTDGAGYLVIGNDAVPGRTLALPTGILQNGPDAIALYSGSASSFPNGTPLHERGLIDALAYGTADPTDTGLLTLLEPGQPQADEAGRGTPDTHAVGRCPNGAGGPRRTDSYRPDAPSPGTANPCAADEPPAVVEVQPSDGATDVVVSSPLSVRFSEGVVVAPGWYEIDCEVSGSHEAVVNGGPLAFTLSPASPFAAGESCRITLRAAHITDADADDPPDHPAADYAWHFRTAPPVASGDVLINEVDADTPGRDEAEFIELYDGGVGGTRLDGLVVVLWNGQNDAAYRAVDLSGTETDAAGYFVVGNAQVAGVDLVVPGGALQNGPDGVALYAGRAADFPSGMPLTTAGLIDALVYGPAEKPDAGLLALLESGQPQVDEDGRGAADAHSLQRCPDNAGGARRTAAYRPAVPTPGRPNECAPPDEPPAVIAVSPPDGARDVEPRAPLTITFSEDVLPDGAWFDIECEGSGQQSAAATGGPRQFVLTGDWLWPTGDTCAVTVFAATVHDADADDPPDTMTADYTWRFTVAASPPAVLINELDADTPGSDTAEFIELYDGGVGETPLDGLVVVVWNGRDDKAYRAFDLTGQATDRAGYFTLGNAAAGVGLVFGDGLLQNGPDAVALYTGRAADFPPGTALTTTGLLDAVVYGPAGSPDDGLLALLEPGQLQVDESGRGLGEADALQRCPDGAGGPRQTAAFRPEAPTPGGPNRCPGDAPPGVVTVSPVDEAVGVAPEAAIVVGFSEDVTVADDWFHVACEQSGVRAAAVSGGPRVYTLQPVAPFAAGERCRVTVFAAAVHDTDADDPPDGMTVDYVWGFYIAPETTAPVAGFVVAGPVWVGEAAAFTNTSGGPGPLVYVWTFGDGSPASEETHPTHRYAAVGEYTVTLSVSGPTGTASYSEVVVVQPRAVYGPLVVSR